jgi:hypothetical protein
MSFVDGMQEMQRGLAGVSVFFSAIQKRFPHNAFAFPKNGETLRVYVMKDTRSV